MSSVVEVILRVRDQASAALRQVEQSAQSLRSSLGQVQKGLEGLGNSLGAVLGSAGVGYALKNAADAAFHAEASMRVLQRSAQAAGQDFAQLKQDLEAVLKPMGILPQQAADATAQLLRAGLKTEEISAAFQAGAASALAAGKTAQDGIQNVAMALSTGQSIYLNYIGIAENIGPVMEKVATKMKGASDEAVRQAQMHAALNVIMKATRQEVAALPDLLGGYAGAQNSLNQSLYQMKIALGQAVLPLLTQLINIVRVAVDAFNSLDPTVKMAIGTGAATAGGILGLATAVGLLLPVFKNVMVVLDGVKGTLLALATNPIVLTITAIGLLATAWVKMADTAEESRKRLSLIGQAFFGIVDIAKGVAQSVAGLFGSVAQLFSTFWNAVKRAVSGDFGGAWEELQKGINLEVFAAKFDSANQSLIRGARELGATFKGEVLDSTRQTIDGFSKLLDKLKESGKQTKIAIPDYSNLANSLNASANAANDAAKNKKALSDALSDLTAKYDAGYISTNQYIAALQRMLPMLENAVTKNKEGSDAWRDAISALTRVRDILQELTDGSKEAAEAFAKAADIAAQKAASWARAFEIQEGEAMQQGFARAVAVFAQIQFDDTGWAAYGEKIGNEAGKSAVEKFRQWLENLTVVSDEGLDQALQVLAQQSGSDSGWADYGAKIGNEAGKNSVEKFRVWWDNLITNDEEGFNRAVQVLQENIGSDTGWAAYGEKIGNELGKNSVNKFREWLKTLVDDSSLPQWETQDSGLLTFLQGIPDQIKGTIETIQSLARSMGPDELSGVIAENIAYLQQLQTQVPQNSEQFRRLDDAIGKLRVQWLDLNQTVQQNGEGQQRTAEDYYNVTAVAQDLNQELQQLLSLYKDQEISQSEFNRRLAELRERLATMLPAWDAYLRQQEAVGVNTKAEREALADLDRELKKVEKSTQDLAKQRLDEWAKSLTNAIQTAYSGIKDISGAFSASSVGQGISQFARGAGSLASLLPGVGSAVGGLISTLGDILGSIVDSILSVFDSGLSKAMDKIKASASQFSLISKDAFAGAVEEYQQSYLFGLITVTKYRINEAFLALAKSIAQALESGVLNGVKNAAQAFLQGAADWAEKLKSGIRSGIENAIIEAVIQGAIVKGALGALLDQLTAALAKGDYSLAQRVIQNIGAAIPGIVAGLENALAPFRDVLQSTFGDAAKAAQNTQGIQYNLPTVSMGAPSWVEEMGHHVATFGSYVEMLVQDGIRIRNDYGLAWSVRGA